jgi:hypothetical protein
VHHRAAAALAPHESLQQRVTGVPHVRPAVPAVGAELLLDALEGVRVDDRLVLAVEDIVVVPHPAHVHDVREQRIERCLVERPPAHRLAGLRRPPLRGPAPALALPHRAEERTRFEVEVEDAADAIGLARVDLEP